METILKFFPFLPEPKDTGKLVLAILFYFFAPGIVGTILAFTIILSPVSAILSLYGLAGIVLAILKYANVDLTGGSKKEETDASEE